MALPTPSQLLQPPWRAPWPEWWSSAGLGAQPQVAVVGGQIGVDAAGDVLAQRQRFFQHLLALGVRRMDVEDEVSAVCANLIAQVYLQFDAGHVWCLGSSQAHPLGVGPHHARLGPNVGNPCANMASQQTSLITRCCI